MPTDLTKAAALAELKKRVHTPPIKPLPALPPGKTGDPKLDTVMQRIADLEKMVRACREELENQAAMNTERMLEAIGLLLE
ncbi:MAG TPA: hypothetical protein VGG79_18155 [Roseiarcus sp.]|jgi:hypothetical protein